MWGPGWGHAADFTCPGQVHPQAVVGLVTYSPTGRLTSLFLQFWLLARLPCPQPIFLLLVYRK